MLVAMSHEASSPMWHAFDDAALRVLHDRAAFAKKTERAEAIQAELVRREAMRNGLEVDESFTADEIAALQELAALLERHGMALGTDGRLFLRVGKHPGMVFHQLEAGDVLAALGVGGPPSRVRTPGPNAGP